MSRSCYSISHRFPGLLSVLMIVVAVVVAVSAAAVPTIPPMKLATRFHPSVPRVDADPAASTSTRRPTSLIDRFHEHQSRNESTNGIGVPVFVMLPLDTINYDQTIKNPDELRSWFTQLKNIGVHGVMTDVFWGKVEYSGPGQYDWTGYQRLFDLIASVGGLSVQAIMSFHQCGGNVGDNCDIPLPQWVLNVGNSDGLYKDAWGHQSSEYVSCGVDNESVFPGGRTGLQLYQSFMSSFRNQFSNYLGNMITEIQVGLGPAGECRYPSYPSDRWSFPGVGAFQCYDKFLRADLSAAASNAGHPEWSNPPSNAGSYNSAPLDTGFFSWSSSDESDNSTYSSNIHLRGQSASSADRSVPSNDDQRFSTPYGQFFQNWYATRMLTHARQVLQQAQSVFGGSITITAKVAGIHWQYKTPSHAAESTAGYFNSVTSGSYRTFYANFAQMASSMGVVFDFTCLELYDYDQPSSCNCGPQELVQQVESIVWGQAGGRLGGENALAMYSNHGYNEVESESQGEGQRLSAFTYLRMSSDLFSSGNFDTFRQFVSSMQVSRPQQSSNSVKRSMTEQ